MNVSRMLYRGLCFFFAAAVFLPIGPAPVRAADGLEQWLMAVDDFNPTVMAAHSRWRAARAETGVTDTWPDPMVGADVERSNTEFGDYNDVEYMVEQELPWFGKRRADIKVASLEAEAVGFEYLEIRRKTQSLIVKAAWELWAARKRLDVARETLSLADQTAAIARDRQEAGQGRQTDLIRASIGQVRMSNDVVTLEREAKVALAELNAQLNQPLDRDQNVGDPPPVPELTASLSTMQEQARQYCCILMASLRRTEASAAAIEAARLEGRPMVSFRVEARQFKESGSIDEFDTGVFMKFPWLWHGKYKSMVEAATADRDMADADFQNEVNMTLTEIQDLYTDAEAHQRTMTLYRESIVPQSKTLVDTSREAYQAGAISAMELLDAQMMYQKDLMSLYEETSAFASKHAALASIAAPWTADEMATGLPPHE